MNRSGKSRLCDFVESTVEDANITRLPSINSKKGEGQSTTSGSVAASSVQVLKDILSLGLPQVTGMPMLRREKRGEAWLVREGVRPPPKIVSLEGMIPSVVEAIGHYVLVDESWAETDRPLYIHLYSQKQAAPSSQSMADNSAGISRVASNMSSGSGMMQRRSAFNFSRQPL